MRFGAVALHMFRPQFFCVLAGPARGRAPLTLSDRSRVGRNSNSTSVPVRSGLLSRRADSAPVLGGWRGVEGELLRVSSAA